MTQLYEGMFLLDNQAVRADWGQAKGVVTEVLAKHGAEVLSARRWDERRLSYPIKGRKRGTYLLAYFQQVPGSAQGVRRALEIEERVLRYLILSAEGVPESELELSRAELAEGFSVPPPPGDDEEPAADAGEETADAQDSGKPRAKASVDEDGAEDAEADTDDDSQAEAGDDSGDDDKDKEA